MKIPVIIREGRYAVDWGRFMAEVRKRNVGQSPTRQESLDFMATARWCQQRNAAKRMKQFKRELLGW